MSDDTAARLLIEMRWQAFHAARTKGGLCAICGRQLADDEAVWLERRRVPGDAVALLRVPVGRECASPEILARTEGQEAERCDGCGRGVYYGTPRRGRRRAICSRDCISRVVAAKRRQAMEGGIVTDDQPDIVSHAEHIVEASELAADTRTHLHQLIDVWPVAGLPDLARVMLAARKQIPDESPRGQKE